MGIVFLSACPHVPVPGTEEDNGRGPEVQKKTKNNMSSMGRE